MRKDFYKELYVLEDKHWWHKAKRRISLQLLLTSLIKKKNNILDLGCGAGKNMEALRQFGTVWGIDTSKEAVYYCKKRGLKHVSIGKAEATTFPPHSFDVVTLFDVLEHTDDAKTLKEIYRILKPNGLLLITVPAFQSLWSQWDIVLHHKKRYTKSSLQKILQQHNFSIMKISYAFSFLFLPAYFVRKIKTKLFKTESYPSDFQLNAPIINNFFNSISFFETFFILHDLVPFGTSVMCLSKKNEK